MEASPGSIASLKIDYVPVERVSIVLIQPSIKRSPSLKQSL